MGLLVLALTLLDILIILLTSTRKKIGMMREDRLRLITNPGRMTHE